MFKKKNKFSKFAQATVDHYNKYPRSHTVIAVVGLVAYVVVRRTLAKRSATTTSEPPLT